MVPHIQTGFHVSRPTHLSSKYAFHIRGYHPLWPHFPVCSIKHIKTFGLIRFRSPLLTESLRFLFLRVLRCFSSPGLLLLRGDISSICRVAPFGHLRIIRVCQSRSFSQLTTSFFASESLGIRHTPLTISFLIYFTLHSRVLGYLFVMSILPLMSMIFFLSIFLINEYFFWLYSYTCISPTKLWRIRSRHLLLQALCQLS